jgi:molecular chaperone Hsp33
MTDAPAAGALVRALLADRAVRLVLVEARGPVRHARRLRDLGPGATRLAGETAVAAGLASAFVKGDEELTLHVQGRSPDGESFAAYGDVTAGGDVRVRVTPPDLVLPEDGAFSGLLAAIKHHGGRELYRGITGVERTTVERALANHLGTSEQVDTILRMGVWQDDDGDVAQAGGILVERLPAEPDLPSLTHEAFAARYGWLADADLRDVLASLAFARLGDERVEVVDQRPLAWRCRCSLAKVEGTLTAFAGDALREMADEDHGAEITCDFCGTIYRVGEARLREILARLTDGVA